jgi:Domain of unknown function (DUF1833)
MTWSTDAVRALWGQPHAPDLAHLLEITSPDLAVPLRVTTWDEAVVSNGRTFEAFPFNFAPPSADSNLKSEATIEIATIDARVATGLNAASAPTVSVEMVRISAPNEPEKIMTNARAVRAQAGLAQANVTLRARAFADEPACQARYTPSRTRGLF